MQQDTGGRVGGDDLRHTKRNRKTARRLCALALLVSILAGSAPAGRMEVNAAAFSNAYSYYTQNGGSVRFWKTSKKDGEIYYATMANVSTASTKFKTLGWKVSVRNTSGKLLQIIYCKLDGSYMKSVDTRVVSGYEYNLYSMKLSSLKSRMITSASNALQEGDCTIVLDACMTVSKSGVPQGSMTDGGSFSGSVYTTYSGIVGAADWSSAAKSSLHSYFDKEVEDLFYDIKVKRSTGISEVSGGGHYLYGTQITVSATVKKGYMFKGWEGIESSDSINYKFYVNESGTITATALPLLLKLVYHRNTSSSDTMLSVQSVNYGDSNLSFKGDGWQNAGKKLAGWGLSQGASEPNYAPNGRISNAFIIKYAPQVHLYAVWVAEGTDELTVGDPDPDSDWDSGGGVGDTPASGTSSGGGASSGWNDDPYVPPSGGYDPYVPPAIDPGSSGSEPESPAVIDPEPEPEPPSDDELPAVEPIRMRFISRAFFEDAFGGLVARTQGGLDPASRWALDLSLRNLLRQILALAEN